MAEVIYENLYKNVLNSLKNLIIILKTLFYEIKK